MAGAPSIEAGQGLPTRGPERDELHVPYAPTTGQLLDDELRIEQQVDLTRTELAGQSERSHRARVLGHVIGLDAEELRDRGIRPRARIARVRASKIEEGRSERGRPWIAPSGPVGPDQKAGPPRRLGQANLQLREQRLAHSGFPPVGWGGPCRTRRHPPLPAP